MKQSGASRGLYYNVIDWNRPHRLAWEAVQTVSRVVSQATLGGRFSESMDFKKEQTVFPVMDHRDSQDQKAQTGAL